jgi:hypothetical protein
MKQRIELNQVREVGDIISDTFIFFKQNIKPLLKAYFVIGGIFIITGIFISVMINMQFANEVGVRALFSFAGFLKVLLGILNYNVLILTGLSYLALYKEKNNQPPDVMEVWRYFKYYFFRVLVIQILLAFAFGIGIFMCFIPGIYLLPVFSLVIPIMVIENANIEYSLKKAFKIIKANWWLTFGTLLLISIITTVVMFVFLVPAALIFGGSQWLTGLNSNSAYSWVQPVITQVCQVLWLLPIIAITLVYYTLTEQKEASSLVNRIKMFGKNNANDQSPFEQY